MDLEAALQKAVNRPTSTQKPKPKTSKPKKPSRSPKTSTPTRGRGGHLKATTAWSKRIPLDVTPKQNKFLASFSVEHETKKNQVLRELIDLLETDSELAQKVLDRLDH